MYVAINSHNLNACTIHMQPCVISLSGDQLYNYGCGYSTTYCMTDTEVCTCGTAQCKLDSCGQTTRAVWHFYPHLQVCVQACTHAMSYPL